MFSVAQIIGFIAFVVTAYGFIQKDEKKLKIVLTIANLIWFAHFFALSAYTACAIIFVIGIRQGISTYYHHADYKFKLKLTYIFIPINIVTGIISWNNWVSFFPMIASIFATVAMFVLEGKNMRKGMLAAEFSWLVNNLYFMSFGGLAANFVNSSLLIYHIFKNAPLTEVEKSTTQSAV